LTDGSGVTGGLAGVRKAKLAVALAPSFLLLTPFYAGLCGWRIAGIHAAFSTILTLLLIELLTIHHDKIPFTCTYRPGSANLKVLRRPIYSASPPTPTR